MYDTKVPHELKDTQKWFASIITRPISYDNEMMPVSPSGKPMTEEAAEFIVPSKGLEAYKRIEIYNQQYWWRLLGILQDNFPVTTRLFGYREFNELIGFPYLVKYPPSHWSLNFLGCDLSKWVQENYFEKDKKLVLDAVNLDYAYNISFFAKKHESVNFAELDPEKLTETKLKLQPFVHLFEFDYDLLKFRFEMMQQEPDYWLEHDFPVMDKGKFYFILFRNLRNYAVSDALNPVAYQMLKLFQNGASIDDVCEWVETQDEKTCEEATKHMQQWFQDWASLQILTDQLE